jgi:trk system potassium uptake protein TrkA
VVVAISRGDITIIPRGDDTIQAGDRIYIFAPQQELPAINYLLQSEGLKKRTTRKAFVLGGSRIGLQVAQNLEKLNIQTKLIEKDEDHCYKLAEQLNKTLVINAEGLDIETLLEEGLAESGVFIAVTENDQTNILTCLLAKRHKVRKTLALVSQPELIGLATELGIDACISPRLAAAGAILKFVRQGEVISLTAVEGSAVNGRTLQDLNFPRGALIGAIVRNGAYEIPTGGSVLRTGDHVVIFTLPEALQKVERFFA